jgi:hypothetical protein
LDLQTRVVRFCRQGIDEENPLVTPTGQTCWNVLIAIQLHLYSFHVQYPHQLSVEIFRYLWVLPCHNTNMHKHKQYCTHIPSCTYLTFSWCHSFDFRVLSLCGSVISNRLWA